MYIAERLFMLIEVMASDRTRYMKKIILMVKKLVVLSVALVIVIHRGNWVYINII